MEIKEVKISDLKPADYNPRKISSKEVDELKTSLKEFGFVEPIIVNSNKSRKNIVIGGHQRLKAWEELGNETIPVNYISLSLKKEKELNIRLNKSGGEFDFELLEEFFEKDDLIDWGFEFIENDELVEPDKKNPEIEFTDELFEEHNYVILYFDNEIDWKAAKQKLNIKTKKTEDSKAGYMRAGTGRILNGASIIEKISDEY